MSACPWLKRQLRSGEAITERDPRKGDRRSVAEHDPAQLALSFAPPTHVPGPIETTDEQAPG